MKILEPCQRTTIMWYMGATVISIVVFALRTVVEDLEERHEELKINKNHNSIFEISKEIYCHLNSRENTPAYTRVKNSQRVI